MQENALVDWMTPFELPEDRSAFIGRSAELEALARLKSNGARLITLTGPAGIGKSRLAIECASILAAQRNSVTLLRADHVQDARFVTRMIATAGASDHWPDLPLKRLPRDLKMVMVLDGLDHVTGIDRVLEHLLSRCPNVLVVATCRAPLNAAGEQVVQVGPLDDHGRALFLQRAGLTVEATQTAEERCRPLGGNPLAIELVAARFDALLPPGDETEMARDCTLPEVVNWAIGQLSPTCQMLLCRISVLTDGFSDSTLRATAALQPSISINPEREITMLLGSGLMRGSPVLGFRIPVAVREVALAQLNTTEQVPTVRLELARYFLHRAVEMRTLLLGVERERGLRWFELEEASLNLALGTFIERHRIYLARKMVSALWPYWVIRGRMLDGQKLLSFVNSSSADGRPDDLERELLFASGLIELLLGNIAPAHAQLAEASRPGCPRAQERWQRCALGALGIVRLQKGESEVAIGHCELYLDAVDKKARRARDGSPLWRSMVQLALSSAHFQLGNWEDANVHAEFVYNRASSQSDPFMQSAARLNQAALFIANEDWQTALNALEECVRLQLMRPQAGILSCGLVGLAQIAIHQSLPELARRLLRCASSIASAGSPLPPYVISITDPGMLAELPIPTNGATLTTMDDRVVVELFEAARSEISASMNPVEAPREKKGAGALTRREIEVLCLVAEDKTDQEIADILFRSPRTVNDHMSNIIGKLGVYSRTGAVVRALVEHWCD